MQGSFTLRDKLEEGKSKCQKEKKVYEKLVNKIREYELNKRQSQILVTHLIGQIKQFNYKLQSCQQNSSSFFDQDVDGGIRFSLQRDLLLEKEKNDHLLKELKSEKEANLKVVGKLKMDLSGVQESNQNLKRVLKEKIAVEIKFRNKLKIQKDRIYTLKSQIKNFSTVYSLEKSELDNKTIWIEHLISEINDKDKKLLTLQQKLSNSERLFDEQNLNNKTDLNENLKFQIKEQNSELLNLHEELQNVTLQNKELNNNLNTIQTELNEKEIKIQHLISELKEKENNFLILQNEPPLLYKSQRLRTGDDHYNKLNTDKSELNNKIQIQKLSTEISEKGNRLVILQKDLDQSISHINNLISEIKKKKNKCLTLQQELGKCDRQYNVCSRKLNTLQSELDNNKHSIQKLQFDLQEKTGQ